MNAYCTYDDDSTYYDFAEPTGAVGGSAGSCGDFDAGRAEADTDADFEYFELGPGRGEAEPGTHGFDPGGSNWGYEDCDAVERHALRKATVESTLQAVTARAGSVDSTGAGSLLLWSAAHLDPATRQHLTETLRKAGGDGAVDEATTALALWRGGALERSELNRLARRLLDSARLALALEDREDSKVIEGPWRRDTPPLERTHHLHVLLLAVRHADLELDEVDEQIAELWQEEIRTELSARQREIRSGTLDPSSGEEHFVESAHFVAAAAEMWRDTAPAARPVRLPLEKLTRLLWRATRTRKVRRPERAALLIAAGNQRLDDLPSKLLEAGLYAPDCDSDDDPNRAVRMLNATWVGGRRPDFGPVPAELNLATESLVLRALSGPARTGPRRG